MSQQRVTQMCFNVRPTQVDGLNAAPVNVGYQAIESLLLQTFGY